MPDEQTTAQMNVGYVQPRVWWCPCSLCDLQVQPGPSADSAGTTARSDAVGGLCPAGDGGRWREATRGGSGQEAGRADGLDQRSQLWGVRGHSPLSATLWCSLLSRPLWFKPAQNWSNLYRLETWFVFCNVQVHAGLEVFGLHSLLSAEHRWATAVMAAPLWHDINDLLVMALKCML